MIFTILVERFGGGELREQPADPGSPGKMAVKTECVCVVERLYTGHGKKALYFGGNQDHFYVTFRVTVALGLWLDGAESYLAMPGMLHVALV